MRARYYDPAVGRFLGRDPLSGQLTQPATQNRFAYVENNPASGVDPLGLCGPLDPGGCFSDATSAVGDAIAQYAVPVATQCAIWGVGGAIAGAGPLGAAAACAAGGGLVILDAAIGPNVASSCAAWGSAGFITGNLAGAAIGCATGVASFYAGDNSALQCATWLSGGFATATTQRANAVRAGVAGCFTATTALLHHGVAYSATPIGTTNWLQPGGAGHIGKE